MSTPAVILIGDLYFYQYCDGDPKCILEEGLAPSIKEAKEKDHRNPDFDFTAILQHLMREGMESSEVNGYSYEYYYEVDSKGVVTITDSYDLNVKCEFSDGKMIIDNNGEIKEYDKWEDFENTLSQ